MATRVASDLRVARAACTSRARRPIGRFVARRSFFGRSDAEQWLEGARDDDGDDEEGERGASSASASASSSIDAAFSALARRRRGLALFEREMAKEEDDVDLLAAACFVAMHADPDVEVERVRKDIDDMASVVRARLDAELGAESERYPLRTIKTISRAFAEDLGFRGNIENYYEVENSCIDRVLARRTGIPITLCLTYMEIAQRCGMPMVDVGIPGHLLCRPIAEGMEVLVDAFNQGDILFIEEVEDILAKNSNVAGKVQIDRSFLSETKIRKKAFLTRMLGNLRAIYDAREDDASALMIVEYMLACNPYESLRNPLRKALGVGYFKTGRWRDAAEALRAIDPDPETEAILERVERILALESDALANIEDDDEE